MRITIRSVMYRFLPLILPALIPAFSGAQEASPTPAFELKSGDRVVFVGNSLFENDVPFGYLELALTTRWPDRQVRFRNIGWTGDMVRGEARSQFTNPPNAYDMLLDQITRPRPTVVFVAYGGVEAYKGEEGLPYFNQGLNLLLDTIDRLGAEAILLSPIPDMSTDNAERTAARNRMLERYSAEIAGIAANRGKRFIDIMNPVKEVAATQPLTDNGFHLNETGYFRLAAILEKGLGLPERGEKLSIQVSKDQVTVNGSGSLAQRESSDNFSFSFDNRLLPLPLPSTDFGALSPGRTVQISGLKKGWYTLTSDKGYSITASAKEWEAGVDIRQGQQFEQSRRLQELIVKKNELFFHQYRPINRTYILGFRSYEQGRHVRWLEDLGIIITWLDGQITLKRKPQPEIYRLTRLK